MPDLSASDAKAKSRNGSIRRDVQLMPQAKMSIAWKAKILDLVQDVTG